ncbi:MAG: c-type cytochrome domain-containing protein [Balneolales bacterium]
MLLIFTACDDNSITGRDPEEDASFKTHVLPIFEDNCTFCHSSDSPQNGVALDSYQAVMQSVGQQYGRSVVEPGDADASPIYNKINPNPQHGVRMPFESTPLSDNQIETIRDWINDGAPNN